MKDFAWLLTLGVPFLLASCGGTVVFEDGGAGGAPSAGGTGGTSSSSSSNSSTGSLSTSSSTTGAGGGPCTDCGGVCVDLTSDAANCGACFDFCFEGEICEGGVCSAVECISEIEAEDSTLVSWSNGWAESFGSVLHGGSGLETWSDFSNDSLTFSFTGTGLIVYHEKGPNRGSFTVTIDDSVSVYVNGHVEGFQFQVPAVISTDLPNGTHSAKLKCDPGTGYCAIDYFGILCD